MLDDRIVVLKLADAVRVKSSGKLTPEQSANVAYLLVNLSNQYRPEGLSLSLVLGLIEVESRFDPTAVSSAKAYGLTQTLLSTSRPYLTALGVPATKESLLSPEISVKVGVAYLIDLHRTYRESGLEDREEWHLSVDSYFWGEGNVRESLASASSSRTGFASRSYWAKVRQAQNSWRALGFQ